MHTALLLTYIALRPLVCIISGEVSARYFVWWLSLGEEVAILKKTVLGTSIVCAAIFMAEAQSMWLIIRHAALFPGDASLLSMPLLGLLIRLFGLVGLCALVYPIVRYAYEERPHVAALDAWLRLFLIVTAYFGGLQTMGLFHCLIMGRC